MDTSNTKVYKARDGWNAKDTIDMATTMWLGITGTRQLEIRTYKNSNGGIHTFASCHFNAAGMTTFDIYGDYRKRVAALLTCAAPRSRSDPARHRHGAAG